MKCSICGKEISKTQIKYGDANALKRDETGKIISRGFHHDCILAKEEKDQLARDAARYLGSIKTAKKARSSAQNGKLGGRPKIKK